MSRYENREDVAAKVAWEGGMEGVLDYGLSSHHLPEDDGELIAAWDEMVDCWNEYRVKATRVEALLPDGEYIG